MKKLLSLVLAAMMLLSFAAVASADTGTIPLYADELNLPAVKTVPTIYTETREDAYGQKTTTLWSSMVLDNAIVMMYDGNFANKPYALDLIDGTTASYVIKPNQKAAKRQVGITSSGSKGITYNWKVFKILDDFGYLYLGEYGTEDKLYDAAIKKYEPLGWDSDSIVVEPVYEDKADILNFYVNVNGKDVYVGYYDTANIEFTGKETPAQKQNMIKDAAEGVMEYLVQTEDYNPKALSWTQDPNLVKTERYHVFAHQFVKYANNNKTNGDDAYIVTVGNQISTHGRSGVCYSVMVQVDEDLFNTDMEFVSGFVTYKKNGNNKAWYAAEVVMNYSEASAVRTLKAVYLPDHFLSLQGYTVTIMANGTTYNLDYNPWGGLEKASASNAAGNYKNTSTPKKGGMPFDWTSTANWKYVRNFSLLSIAKLQKLFTRLY